MCALRRGTTFVCVALAWPTASGQRIQGRGCRGWVGSGSSIHTLERPLRCIDLTFSRKRLRFVSCRCRCPPSAGHPGGGPRSDSVAGLDWNGGAFGPEYAHTAGGSAPSQARPATPKAWPAASGGHRRKLFWARKAKLDLVRVGVEGGSRGWGHAPRCSSATTGAALARLVPHPPAIERNAFTSGKRYSIM